MSTAVETLTVANAPLPLAYESAKAMLIECVRIDECQGWADKAQALASYARQAKEDELRKMADRIQARAVQRAGELLKELDGRGDHRRTVGTHGSSQRDAAAEAGMSEHQQLQAVRVANVPEIVFVAAVESDDPPTVTQLAEQGKKTRPLIDLQGRDPEDFKLVTNVWGELGRMAEMAASIDVDRVPLGVLPDDDVQKQMIERIDAALPWLARLKAVLEDSGVRG